MDFLVYFMTFFSEFLLVERQPRVWLCSLLPSNTVGIPIFFKSNQTLTLHRNRGRPKGLFPVSPRLVPYYLCGVVVRESIEISCPSQPLGLFNFLHDVAGVVCVAWWCAGVVASLFDLEIYFHSIFIVNQIVTGPKIFLRIFL